MHFIPSRRARGFLRNALRLECNLIAVCVPGAYRCSLQWHATPSAPDKTLTPALKASLRRHKDPVCRSEEEKKKRKKRNALATLTFFIAPIYLETMLPSNNSPGARVPARVCVRACMRDILKDPFMALKGRVETDPCCLSRPHLWKAVCLICKTPLTSCHSSVHSLRGLKVQCEEKWLLL